MCKLFVAVQISGWIIASPNVKFCVRLWYLYASATQPMAAAAVCFRLVPVRPSVCAAPGRSHRLAVDF